MAVSLRATTGDRLDRAPDPAFDRADEGDRIQGMKQVMQIGDNWCWAASIESVLATCCAPPPRRQRQIVREKKKCPAAGCKSWTPSKKCDETIDRDELADLWHQEGFAGAYYEEKTLTFKEVLDEIAAGRPVQVELGNRHVVLLTGWYVLADGQRRVEVVDTHKDGKPHASFDDLDDYPSAGRWGDWHGTCRGLVYTGAP